MQFITEQLARQRERPVQLGKELLEAKDALVGISAELERNSANATVDEMTETLRLNALARQEMRTAQVQLFELELGTYDQRMSLMSAELEQAHREVVTQQAREAAASARS